MTGTHVSRWLSVLPRMVLAGLEPGCEKRTDASKFLLPTFDFAEYRTCMKRPRQRAINHCQNITPTKHSGQSMTILVLAFAFCSSFHSSQFGSNFVLFFAQFGVLNNFLLGYDVESSWLRFDVTSSTVGSDFSCFFLILLFLSLQLLLILTHLRPLIVSKVAQIICLDT